MHEYALAPSEAYFDYFSGSTSIVSNSAEILKATQLVSVATQGNLLNILCGCEEGPDKTVLKYGISFSYGYSQR